ncbi:MAG: endonuclease [Bacteroidales bacterium]|nr:endonuclease [Bacteroidales bacterium]
MNQKTITTCILLFVCSIFSSLFAQAPEHYYDAAVGKKGKALQQALADIISNNYKTTYYGTNGGTEVFVNTATGITYYPECFPGDTCNTYKAAQFLDRLEKDSTYDIYSYPCCDISIVDDYGMITDGHQCQQYSFEHLFCQSWFNPNEVNGTCTHNYTHPFAACSDLHHLFPTDHYINSSYHNNYPYGEVYAPIRISQNGTRMGYPNYRCCDASVKDKITFEPSDRFKGDVARALLYIAVRYMNEDENFAENAFVKKSQFQPWAFNLLKKWHKMDPVSQKEIDRNNTIFAIQHNRNPFIDHPELVELIWGSDSLYDKFGYPSSTEVERPVLETVTLNGNQLVLEFSADLDKTSAEQPENYLLTRGAFVQSASCNGKKVTLALSDLIYNTRYHLYLHDIKSSNGAVIKPRTFHFLNGEHHSYYNFCEGPREVLALWSFDAKSDLIDSLVLKPNTDIGETDIWEKSFIYGNGDYASTKLAANQYAFGTTSSTNAGDPRKNHAKGSDSYFIQLTKRTSAEMSLVIKTSTKNWKDIMLTFVNIHTASGYKNGKWAWSLDGENYTDVDTENPIADFGGITSASTWWMREIDFRQIDEIENRDSVFFRLTLSDASSASGNNKLDNFVIYGEPLDYQEDNSGIQEKKTVGFDLFPNPNNGEFTVKCAESSDFTSLIIYDIAGKMMERLPIDGNLFVVNVNHYPSGIYFVRLLSKTGASEVKKVVISR